jgi:glutamate dehydrogenase/leucine dehydrogenase
MLTLRRAAALKRETDPGAGFCFSGYEKVVFVSDRKSGLRGVIAIHSTQRGPAAGATRFAPYANDMEVLTDAMRLARGMTAKCALADLPFGGGKGAIVASGRKTPAILKAYATEVSRLNGRFITGEDYGMTTADVRTMRTVSPFITGTSEGANPAYWTSRGMFSALMAGARYVWGSESISGKIVGVSGLGKVGLEFSRFLKNAGAIILAEEINPAVAKNALREIPDIRLVKPGTLNKQKLDIFSPCARGGVLNKASLAHLRADIVCGGANNQLLEPEDGVRLHKAGILYLPDFAVNAGGVISVTAEMRIGGWNKDWVQKKTDMIGTTIQKLIKSSRGKIAMSVAADDAVAAILKRPSRRSSEYSYPRQ